MDVFYRFKEGRSLDTIEKSATSRYSVEKKISSQNETLVQLEILEADLNDSGVYELVARTDLGEEQSRKVELTEEAIKLSIQENDAADGKKKKKKIVKKKKKGDDKKEVKKPEITTWLRNMVRTFLHLLVL